MDLSCLEGNYSQSVSEKFIYFWKDIGVKKYKQVTKKKVKYNFSGKNYSFVVYFRSLFLFL